MRTYIKYHLKTTDPLTGVVSLGSPQYWLRDVGGSCAEDRAVLLSLKPAENPDLGSPAVPASPLGWQVRSCDDTPQTGGTYTLGSTDELIESGASGTETENPTLVSS